VFHYKSLKGVVKESELIPRGKNVKQVAIVIAEPIVKIVDLGIILIPA
jgi:hypothetical protein